MINKLLPCWAVLAALSYAHPVDARPKKLTPAEEYQTQKDIIAKMSEKYGVEVNVSLEVCGELNGYYSPDSNTIHLCTESYETPGVGRFIAAHEMGHAVLWNLNGDLSEYHADELATITLLEELDDVSDVQAGAAWFIMDASPKFPGDEHPSDKYRAVWLLTMVDGYLHNGGARAELMYQGTLVRYDLMLKLDDVTHWSGLGE